MERNGHITGAALAKRLERLERLVREHREDCTANRAVWRGISVCCVLIILGNMIRAGGVSLETLIRFAYSMNLETFATLVGLVVWLAWSLVGGRAPWQRLVRRLERTSDEGTGD